MSATPKPWHRSGTLILSPVELTHHVFASGPIGEFQKEEDAELSRIAVNSHDAALALADAVLLAREIPDPYALGEHFQKLFALARKFKALAGEKEK